MDMNKLVTTTLVSLALAAAAPLAAAQATAPEATQQRQAQGKRDSRLPSERVEARLADAKTKLKITAQQEAQWNAFADVTRRHAKAADERIKTMRDGKSQAQSKQLTAVERLERRQQMAATHAQRLTEVIAAAKPLYAALSAEQKAIADDMLTPRRGQGGRGHHRPA
jgi:periplasmic protein CpxP/Spy